MLFYYSCSNIYALYSPCSLLSLLFTFIWFIFLAIYFSCHLNYCLYFFGLKFVFPLYMIMYMLFVKVSTFYCTHTKSQEFKGKTNDLGESLYSKSIWWVKVYPCTPSFLVYYGYEYLTKMGISSLSSYLKSIWWVEVYPCAPLYGYRCLFKEDFIYFMSLNSYLVFKLHIDIYLALDFTFLYCFKSFICV